jgi:hypothetical protein
MVPKTIGLNCISSREDDPRGGVKFSYGCHAERDENEFPFSGLLISDISSMNLTVAGMRSATNTL